MGKLHKLQQLRRCFRGRPPYGEQPGLPGCPQLKKDLTGNPHGNLILLDVADLNKVTNAHSHDVGNRLLHGISQHIQSVMPAGSKLYGLNQVDFGLLLTGGGQEDAEALAQRLLADCARPWSLEVDGTAFDIYFHAIAGVLPLEQVENSTQAFNNALEYVVRQAHAHGGFGQFVPEEYRVFVQRKGVENELRKSLAENMQGFYLVYQPIIDPATGLWRGLEALCRWQSPELGSVSPEEFIPVAESTGMIFRIGEWVVQTAIKQIKELGLDNAPQFVLDVNVSPVQLTGRGLERCVLRALEKHSYPAKKLCLEITESSEVSQTGPMLNAIERLTAHGVQFALDDFGTGYSTISELYKLPIKIVKTDRSLVQGIDSDTELQRLFYSVAEMAHGGGMHIVAEGVESRVQADTLLLQGVDYFQGYHFSKPISYAQLKTSTANFYTSVGSIPAMDYRKVDLNIWDDAPDNYVLPLSIYRTLSRCVNVLFKDNDVDRAIESVLAIVGPAMGVSRAGLFLRDSRGTSFSITNQWCAEGIKPSLGEVQNLDIMAYSPGWHASLQERGLFLSADVAQLPPEMRAILSVHDIRAIAQFALMQGDTIVGFATFDECTRVRYWTREEIRMLHILASMLSGAIGRRELRRQARLHYTQMTTILNRMDSMIYTSNLETGEIYFANSKLLQASGQESVQGKTCWEVLHNADKRCRFCPMLNLTKTNDPDAIEHLEFYSKPLQAHLKVSGSIIPWEDGKDVLLVSCVNINELIQQQQMLQKSAEIDPLTKACNRAGFFPAAENLFMVSAANGQTSALAFLDVDGLKRTNDEQGHAAGDALLCTVVDSVMESVRDTDIVARMGGDEFIVVFHNCSCENAARKLDGILLELKQQSTGAVEPASFSYGVVDTAQYPYQPGRAYIEELVDKADALQLQQKIKKYGAARDEYCATHRCDIGTEP